MENTKIEWATHTFNPWTGCTKVSPGCAHCYAEGWAKRSGQVEWGPGQPRQRTKPANWAKPRRWNAEAAGTGERPRVFCASLADWLDDEVPVEWLADLLQLVHATPRLDWLLLTKRPGNFEARVGRLIDAFLSLGALGNFTGDGVKLAHWFADWRRGKGPKNVWIGTTVEDQTRADERIPQLLAIPARVRFLSCEPLLGQVDLQLRGLPGWDEDWKLNALTGAEWANPRDDGIPEPHRPRIHWVICGGESGPGARPMHPAWARRLRDQCTAANVPFHFKQWGGVHKASAGRVLDGRTWDEVPTLI